MQAPSWRGRLPAFVSNRCFSSALQRHRLSQTPRLYSASGAEIAKQLRDMAAKAGTCGIIFDIRGAGGNDLAAVVEIASLFDGSTNVLYRVEDGFGRETVVQERTAACAFGRH